MENKKKIKAIVFDLGNVLLPFDYEIVKSELNKVKEGLGEKYVKNYFENYSYHREFEKGMMNKNIFIKKNLEWCDNLISEESFCKIYSCHFKENTGLTSLLPQLKNSYKLYLLSNTNEIHRKFGWEKYGFLKKFDELFLSYELKANKPEVEIFERAHKRVNLPKESVLFIDDVEEYTLAAKKFGWNSIQFKNNNQLFYDLSLKLEVKI